MKRKTEIKMARRIRQKLLPLGWSEFLAALCPLSPAASYIGRKVFLKKIFLSTSIIIKCKYLYIGLQSIFEKVQVISSLMMTIIAIKTTLMMMISLLIIWPMTIQLAIKHIFWVIMISSCDLDEGFLEQGARQKKWDCIGLDGVRRSAHVTRATVWVF